MPSEARAVHAALTRFVAEHASPPLAALIGIHLASWEPMLSEPEPIGAVLAPRTARALGARANMESVGAATWSFFLGIDLLDNVADRELAPSWTDAHGANAPDLASLAALALVQSIPPTILAEADLPLESRARLAELFASSSWTMIEGQLRDVLGGEHVATLDLTEAMISQKSGFRARLFTLAGLIAARAEVRPAALDCALALERFAVALGTAGELTASLVDLFASSTSRDLLNGKRTWPILRALERLEEKAPKERRRLEKLLVDARAKERHRDVLAEVRALLEAGETPMLTALRIELWVARAKRAIREAELADPQPLEVLLDRLSVLSRVGKTSAGV